MTLYSSLSEWYFLNGIKRTCINYPNFSKFEQMKKEYPYVDKKEFIGIGDNCIFFQTEELKEQMLNRYLRGNENVPTDSPEYHRIIGNILEYPPKSIDFFIKGGSLYKPVHAVHMRYCGNNIVANILDLEDNVKWLWAKFPYPLDDTLLLQQGANFIFIDYGDYNKVREIVKNTKHYIKNNR